MHRWTSPLPKPVSVSALVLLLSNLSGAAPPRELFPTKIRQAERLVKREMARLQIPGLSLAVVLDDRVAYAGGFGSVEPGGPVPAAATTVYRCASISKAITAVAVMQLAERGALDLDASVGKYCPSFPDKQWPVTPRQLLGHLAGVRSHEGEERGNTRHYATIAEGLLPFRDDPLLHEPETKYLYSTYGYNVLGCAIEGASGRSYLEYLRENVFAPAGMEDTRDDAGLAALGRPTGYRKGSDGRVRPAEIVDTSNKLPGAGLVSTVQDLARFALALRTGQLVRPETAEAMWTPQRTRGGKETSYGLGFGVMDRDGVREVFHAGGLPGVSGVLYLAPRKRVAVVLMANLEGVQASLTVTAREIAILAVQ